MTDRIQLKDLPEKFPLADLEQLVNAGEVCSFEFNCESIFSETVKK